MVSVKTRISKSPLVTQWAKDPALSPQQLGLLWRYGFHPCPWHSGMRIWCCCSLDSIPGPGTSICSAFGQRKKEAKKERKEGHSRQLSVQEQSPAWVAHFPYVVERGKEAV